MSKESQRISNPSLSPIRVELLTGIPTRCYFFFLLSSVLLLVLSLSLFFSASPLHIYSISLSLSLSLSFSLAFLPVIQLSAVSNWIDPATRFSVLQEKVPRPSPPPLLPTYTQTHTHTDTRTPSTSSSRSATETDRLGRILDGDRTRFHV